MRRARQDTTIERREIKLDGNLITNEIYWMAQVIWFYKDEQGNTWATNYQPYNPCGILLNKQWNEERFIFKPYKFQNSYWRPCAELVEKKLRAEQKELQKNLKLFCKTNKKYFLTFFNHLQKIGYNIKVNLKQGEFIKMTDDKFIKKQPDKVERMTKNAKTFMGLTISINDPKKKEFFWINQLDPSFEYFGIGSVATPFNQETKKGKTIKKYVWDLDNLDKPLYAPSWMALKSENENNVPYWVVAIKNDDYNKDLIKKLIEISGDSVQHITKENKDNFKVLY